MFDIILRHSKEKNDIKKVRICWLITRHDIRIEPHLVLMNDFLQVSSLSSKTEEKKFDVLDHPVAISDIEVLVIYKDID